MALDPVPTYPGQYDAIEANNNPDGSETRREGDDQIRRMKASEKQTWTNITGAVTASHTELNTLTGISTTDPITTFPSGTKMIFNQLAAPTDWTIDATLNEHSIALVGATGGGTTGGTKDFTTVFQTHAEGAADGVGDHTLVDAELPSTNFDHGHAFRRYTGAANQTGTPTNYLSTQLTHSTVTGIVQDNTVMIQTTSGLTFGSDTPHGHSLDLDVKRANCIVASKD